MAKVRVRNNHLHFNGINYFRAKSEDVELASYGEKRTPVLGMNFLEIDGQINPDLFDRVEVTTAEIDIHTTNKGDLTEMLSGRFKGVDVDANAGQMWDKMRNAELKLVKFAVSLGELREAANRDRRAFENLKFMSGRARIVSDIWVVTSAELAEDIERAQSFDVSAEKGKIKVGLNGTTSQSGTRSVTLSKNTTFAYLLAEIEWDKKRKKKRKRITDLDTDQWGPG